MHTSQGVVETDNKGIQGRPLRMKGREALSAEVWLLYALILLGLLALLVIISLGDERLILFRGYALIYGGGILVYLTRKLPRMKRVALLDLLLMAFAVFFGLGSAFTSDVELMVTGAPAEDALTALLLTAIGLMSCYFGARWMGRCIVAGGSEALEARLIGRISSMKTSAFLLLFVSRILLIWFQVSSGLVISGLDAMPARIGSFASLLLILSMALRPFAIMVALLLLRHKRLNVRVMAGALSAVEAWFCFLAGRRILLSMLVIGILVLTSWGQRLRMRQMIAGLVAGALLVAVVWPFFFQARKVAVETEWVSRSIRDEPMILISEVLPAAWETYDVWDMLRADSEYTRNVKVRAYILRPVQQTIAAVRNGAEYLYGDVLLRCVQLTIPGFLWPGKASFFEVNDQPKLMIQAHYGLSRGDESATLFYNGFADGGLVGVIAYLFVFGMVVGFVEYRALKARSALIGLFVLGLCLNWVFLPEFGLESVLADVRIIIAALLIDRFFGRQMDDLTMTQGLRVVDAAPTPRRQAETRRLPSGIRVSAGTVRGAIARKAP